MGRLRVVSTVGWGFPSWNEDEEARLLSDFGVRHVQAFRNIEKNITAQEIRNHLGDYGISVVALHAFFGEAWDLSLPDEASRKKAAGGFAGEAEFCLSMGGDLVIVHPGGEPIGDQTRDPARVEALRRSAHQLVEIGSRTGCRFALENLPRGQMGDDVRMMRQIVEEFDSPYLGLNYDCGHANLSDGVMETLDAAGQRIIGTHIHDNNGQADDHFVPGFGSIRMEAVCRGLAGHGYRGDFTLELMGSTDEIRDMCDGAWWEKFNRWVDMASGIVQ